MSCSLCGDICRCSSSVAPPTAPESENQTAAESSAAWRQEVAARLTRYQTRRKPRPPRYPSLRLKFEADDTLSSGTSSASSFFPTVSSNQALALNEFVEHEEDSAIANSDSFARAASADHVLSDLLPLEPTPQTAKILEFPRSWTPAPPPLDELAEPVLDRPRILDVPEIEPPAPALGGIIIEPAHQPAVERRPGIDVPLQSASLSRRIFAACVDAAIIALATAVFGSIFWKVTGIRPPRLQIAGIILGLLAIFWAGYQYLLLVYSGTTPGIRLAGLELARFNGTHAARRLRRWRVLASFLSAASLGMGYLWVFLDEDGLCWHDRITHTYLAPKGR